MHDEWSRALNEGRVVHYSRDVSPSGTVMNARIDGESVTWTGHAQKELTREEVEAEFADDLRNRDTGR